MEYLFEFPSLGRRDLSALKKSIDAGFREFSRTYGETLETLFYPILKFLIWFEKLLINTPWPIIMIVIAALCYFGARSWKLSLGAIISLQELEYLECRKTQWRQWLLFQSLPFCVLP